MTNRYFNNAENLTPFTKARAADVEQDLSSVSVGFTVVQGELDAAIRAPSGEVLGPLPALAGRASKSLAFDASGDPIAVVAATSVEMAAAVAAASSASASAASATASAATLAGSVNAIQYLMQAQGVL